MSFRGRLLTEAEQLERWKEYVDTVPILRSAVAVLQKISKKGYKAYITGGTVRDIILGLKPHDIDIATNMPIEQISSLYKTYDIGKSKDFGIVVVREGGYSYEVAQFREDGRYLDGRRPETVKVIGSFQKDAERRDFTINAMAVDMNGNIIDYFDGRKDIQNKVIRTVGNPLDRFGEDYLRMMRAARFSAKLGFDIEPETKKAAKTLATNIRDLAPERIKDEIWKAAAQSGDKFAKFLTELDDMGILELILPELTNLKGLEHNLEFHPEGHVWDHVLTALKANQVADPLVNLAILLHDVGKGVTFDKKPDGTPIYYGHAEEGVKLVNQIADRLRMSAKERETLLYAVSNHMKFHKIIGMKPSKIAKLVSDENWDVLVAVARADEFARGQKFMSDTDFESIVDTAVQIKKKWGAATMTKMMKIVDGNRVMELTGLSPGPAVGRIIKIVTDWAIDNNVTDQDEIDKYILQVAKK
jgi:tRNA nucleotidyltransferase/poly(A) polymerase